MQSQWKLLAAIASIAIIVFTIIVMINQTAQAVQLANTINPGFGRIVLFSLLAFYASAFLTPVVIFLRMPKALTPPEEESSPEFQVYLKKLGARLERNPNLKGQCGRIANREEIQAAFKILDTQSTAIIKQKASTVFLSTAISQNGRLDAITVLVAQTRMVWQIAHLYNQRPTLHEMTHLYANVGAAVLLAGEIQDIDVSQHIEPTIRTVIGTSLVAYVPGASALSSVVIHSILEGTSNAYLTLRVGIICQRYCSSLKEGNRTLIARSASAAAAVMLGSIVTSSGTAIAQAIASVAKKASVSAVESAAGRVREVGAKLNPFA